MHPEGKIPFGSCFSLKNILQLLPISVRELGKENEYLIVAFASTATNTVGRKRM